MSTKRGRADQKIESGEDMWAVAAREARLEAMQPKNEFSDVEVSPAFKPINSTSHEAVGVDQAAKTTTSPDTSAVSNANNNKPMNGKLPFLGAIAASIVAVVVIGAQSWPSATANQTDRVTIDAPASLPGAEFATPPAQEHAMATSAGLDSGSVSDPSESKSQYAPATVVTFNGAIEADSQLVAGKSLAQLVKGSPAYTPIEGLPESQWREETCNACHTWEQKSLCTQGEFYVKHGFGAVARKDHPYGGAFKNSVMAWAKDGCR